VSIFLLSFRFGLGFLQLMLIKITSPHLAEKKELLMKARYDAIASSGGKRAVKKAIEKKQKKQSQKEKRSRPFPAPGHAPSNSKNTSISTGSNNINIGSGSAQKRARFTVDEERTQPSKKRRKF
jgi:ribosomal RNA-processing protein 36